MSDRGIGPLVGRAGVPHMVLQALRWRTVSIVGGRNENNFLRKTINDHQDRGVLY